MNKKYVKLFVLAVAIFIISALFIGGNYYVNVSTFNLTKNSKKFTLCSSMESCFDIIKKEVDNKYVIKINDIISTAKSEYSKKRREILGEEYQLLNEKHSTLLCDIKNERQKFFESDDYIKAKETLQKRKEDFDSDPENVELKNQLNQALNALSTLNITINNRLKEKREKLDGVKCDIKKLYDNKREEIFNLYDTTIKTTTKKIKEVLGEYYFEIAELKKVYKKDVEVSVMAFASMLNTDNIFTSFEKDYFSNIYKDGTKKAKIVYSEDTFSEIN